MGLSFAEFEYWSVMHGADVVRVSVPDQNGQEFFAIVPVDGEGYSKRREQALALIVRAMEMGCDPGEVRGR